MSYFLESAEMRLGNVLLSSQPKTIGLCSHLVTKTLELLELQSNHLDAIKGPRTELWATIEVKSLPGIRSLLLFPKPWEYFPLAKIFLIPILLTNPQSALLTLELCTYHYLQNTLHI
jgi:hypothetical protein